MAQRTVILYDWLHHKEGGGERMLFEVLALYPDADLVALTYDASKYGDRLAGRSVRASWMNALPRALRDRPQWLLPFIKSAVKNLPIQEYDRVIAVSSAWVKNVPLSDKQKCVVYCFSPARFLWDSWPESLNGRTRNPIVRFVITWLVSRLRLWDYYQSQSRQLTFIAISKTIQSRIKKFYGRDSQVVYPVVEVDGVELSAQKADYYIVVSVLARYKHIDLAIKACKKLKRRLVIVGDGPDRSRLEAVAGGSKFIEFYGRVTEEKKVNLLAGSRGFIFSSIEDFGIAPVEALAAGTPVIAREGGGVSETVPVGSCGVFYKEPTVEAVATALRQAEKINWKTPVLQAQAKKFNRQQFLKSWQKVVG